MNPIDDDNIRGKVGELLIQSKLLFYGIQAAPPIFDSGNDLIALKGRTIKSIQVKTKKFETQNWNLRPTDRDYDIMALVGFAEVPEDFDEAEIYLLSKAEVAGRSSISPTNELNQHSFSNKVNQLFR